jgi:hypothetical protein
MAESDGEVMDEELMKEATEAVRDEADDKFIEGIEIFGEVGIKIDDNGTVDKEPTQFVYFLDSNNGPDGIHVCEKSPALL